MCARCSATPVFKTEHQDGDKTGVEPALLRIRFDNLLAGSMTTPLTPYPRDLVGYGPTPPPGQRPGGARVALQFVLNYEEGGENSVLHGDAGSEQFLSEMANPPAYAD